MIKIVIVDDNDFVREGLCLVLTREDDMQIVGAVADAESALLLLKDELEIDILITDITMPVVNGLELTRLAKAIRQDLNIIVLTLHSQLIVKQQVLSAGARECLIKDSDFDKLFSTIREVHIAQSVHGIG